MRRASGRSRPLTGRGTPALRACRRTPTSSRATISASRAAWPRWSGRPCWWTRPAAPPGRPTSGLTPSWPGPRPGYRHRRPQGLRDHRAARRPAPGLIEGPRLPARRPGDLAGVPGQGRRPGAGRRPGDDPQLQRHGLRHRRPRAAEARGQHRLRPEGAGHRGSELTRLEHPWLAAPAAGVQHLAPAGRLAGMGKKAVAAPDRRGEGFPA